jgi:hypothetical protein
VGQDRHWHTFVGLCLAAKMVLWQILTLASPLQHPFL